MEMQIETTMKFTTLHWLGWVLAKYRKKSSTVEDVEKLEHLFIAGGN